MAPTDRYRSWSPRRPSSNLAGAARGILKKGAASLGYEVRRRPPGPVTSTDHEAHLLMPPDFDDETVATVHAVRGYTLTPPERVAALCDAVRYLVRAGIDGALVECGVWRGGSALAMIRTLQSLGRDDRHLFLFDTFERMPPPGPLDVDFMGVPAADNHALWDSGAGYDHRYDFLPFDAVRQLLLSTRYPAHLLHFVRGLVEETVPEEAPESIALLRLDTDYYQSTRHELAHLYPRIPPGGVLLIDDYGHFLGCRRAVDEHVDALASEGVHLLLHQIDYSARLAVVPYAP